MATNPDVAMEKARRRFLMVWTAVGAILLTGAAVYLINILSVPIGILLWTLVIVFCLRGTVNKLESKGVPGGNGHRLSAHVRRVGDRQLLYALPGVRLR